MNKITLYKNNGEIKTQYGENLELPEAVIVEKTRQEIEFIMTADIEKVTPKLKKRYKETQLTELDKIKDKFNIVAVNRKIYFNPENNES